MPPEGPTSELGTVTQGGAGVLPWGTFIDDREYAPDLKWPQNITRYDRMLADGQVKGLYWGSTLPIRRFRWMIDPNGARQEIVKHVAEDLGLPIKGKEEQKRRRRKGRFSHDAHLMDALRALAYGHYFFEQVGAIKEDGKWHLKKLAPRPPYTIMEIKVENDGGLQSIKQNLGFNPPPISVDRLVAYVWDMEAGQWTGRSMLRSCYRDWLIKDRLMRVDAMKHERASMGLPVTTAPEDASKGTMDDLHDIAKSVKAGEEAGVALPHGASLTIEGVRGTLPDVVGSMRFHNEEMARAFLMMFMQLGQTESGSRALGSEFIDFFAYAQESIADWYADIFNEHVIEDLVDWNYGEEEQVPLLVYERSGDEDLAIADLKQLVDAGAIVVDDELESALRKKYKLPEKAEEEEPETLPAPPPPAPPAPEGEEPPTLPAPTQVEAGGDVAAADLGSPSLPLPARPLRRQPYEHEIQAQVDYALIDATMEGAVGQIVAEVNLLQRSQIDELHDAIVAAGGDLGVLASLEVAPVAADAISAAMVRTADAGIIQAAAEGERQGATISRPRVDDLTDSLRARAEAVDVVLAKSLSEVASRQAINRTGGALSATEVADEVRNHILGLTDTYLKDQLGGALTQAMNSGRKIVIRDNNARNIYSSELLDTNTCPECAAKDGTDYGDDLDMAEQDYPTGGYKNCRGGPRCRGTLVAVYNEAGGNTFV